MGNNRNNAIDAAKLLAAFGVVMIHLAPSTPAAEMMSRIFLNFSVPFFLMIALYFFIQKVSSMEPVRASSLHLDRILVPYATWTVVYLVLRLVKYRVQHKVFDLDLVPVLFYGGTGVQMYFLPLLLLLQAQALSILLILRKPINGLTAILIIFGAIAFGWFGSHENYFGFQNCFERGCVYVLFAFLLRYSQSNPFGRRANLFLGGTLMVLTVAATLTDYHARWLVYVGGPLAGYGIAALSLNLVFAVKAMAWQFLLTCSYGIYLAHPLFIESFQLAVAKLGYVTTPYSVLTKVLMSLLITFCCVLLIWFIRLSRASAYFLLGEANHRSRVILPHKKANA